VALQIASFKGKKVKEETAICEQRQNREDAEVEERKDKRSKLNWKKREGEGGALTRAFHPEIR
jgi:hypothetical protein